MALLKQNEDLEIVLIAIYCFVDDFLKQTLYSIEYALEKPTNNKPPIKKKSLSLSESITLGIFRYIIGYRCWKDFYKHLKTYHSKDFPNLPNYQNFMKTMNKTSLVALVLLQSFMSFFKKNTSVDQSKCIDSMKLDACKIKREFTNKVCKGYAKKGKSSMGWFYGFKLHLICNEFMEILNFQITSGNTDDRACVEALWNDIFGMIIADAGYVSKDLTNKAPNLGKQFLTGVRKNMKKIMTTTQHQLLKLRQRVETVFSVLKFRMGMETSLPRSIDGLFAHYIWCITAYQLDRFFSFVVRKPLLA